MLFNSISFLLFLPIVFILYWYVFQKNVKIQNAFIVVVSYFFYACWDWRFLFLIAFCSGISYFSGAAIEQAFSSKRKRLILWICTALSLGLLAIFKYFNFFIDSFIELFALFGIYLHPFSLKIILPVGISFYTFQSLSYAIDVYRGKIKATKDIIAFFAFVSFFPQLVAGPIERATNFLPQFFVKRNFDYVQAVDGLKQILWGFFKKVVIADRCAHFVDVVYGDISSFSGSTLLLVALLYSFQIYGDFSGYSDIAIGTSRLFGFNLKRNFAYPYFSRDIGEFWRRWHISLTTWFKDYVYIPLGGSRQGMNIKIRNTFVIFFLSALWHGANWTFVIWGMLHFLFFLPSIVFGSSKKGLDIVAADRKRPSLKELGSIIVTFILVSFAWIFFRSDNLNTSIAYISSIFSGSLFSLPNLPGQSENLYLFFLLLVISFFILIEWFGRREEYAIATIVKRRSKLVRWGFYAVLIFIIGIYMQTGEMPFVYFQF